MTRWATCRRCGAEWNEDEYLASSGRCKCGMMSDPHPITGPSLRDPFTKTHMRKSDMREFETGATRDDDSGKLDYEGFLSPLVLRRFAEYMHEHRIQPDGALRASDNWQKGIPRDAYMKSEWRHHVDLWLHHRGLGHLARESLEEALCGLLFNVQGYLHETLEMQREEAQYREAMRQTPTLCAGFAICPECDWQHKLTDEEWRDALSGGNEIMRPAYQCDCGHLFWLDLGT